MSWLLLCPGLKAPKNKGRRGSTGFDFYHFLDWGREKRREGKGPGWGEMKETVCEDQGQITLGERERHKDDWDSVERGTCFTERNRWR